MKMTHIVPEIETGKLIK